MPKCQSTDDLLQQVDSLRTVADASVIIGISGPDAICGAAEIVGHALTLPGGVKVSQAEVAKEIPQSSDVVVVLVDASTPYSEIPTATRRPASQNEGSIGGRSLIDATSKGPVGDLIQRACRSVGTRNVFLGVAGCGAEAAGTPEDQTSTEESVSRATGLQPFQVACFSLPGGSLFGGGEGGGTVGGRKRLLAWCSHLVKAAKGVQRERMEQLEGLLAPLAGVVGFWQELRTKKQSTSMWVIRHILWAAVEGARPLHFSGCEDFVAQHPVVKDRDGILELIHGQTEVTFKTSFLGGIGGIFTAPVGMPMSAAGGLLVQMRLCLIIAALADFKPIEPAVVAASLCCVSGSPQIAWKVLYPKLPHGDPPDVSPGSSDLEAILGGLQDGAFSAPAREAFCAAHSAAEGARQKAVSAGKSPSQARAAAQAAYATRLPVEIVHRAANLLLDSYGANWLGHAAQTLPLMGGLLSGQVHRSSTQRVGVTAAEVFMPSVQVYSGFDVEDVQQMSLDDRGVTASGEGEGAAQATEPPENDASLESDLTFKSEDETLF